jgi:hypothetical protein
VILILIFGDSGIELFTSGLRYWTGIFRQTALPQLGGVEFNCFVKSGISIRILSGLISFKHQVGSANGQGEQHTGMDDSTLIMLPIKRM